MSGAQPDYGATLHVSGAVTAPAASGTIAGIGALAAGTWEVTCQAAYGAVGDVAANMNVQKSGVAQATLLVPGGANVVAPPLTLRLVSNGADTVSVKAIAAGAAGAVYLATIVARRVA